MKIFFLVHTLFILVVGLFGGFLFFRQEYLRDFDTDKEVREWDSKYEYVNPLLECSVEREVLRMGEFRPDKDTLNSYIEKKKASGDIEFASVYYRDLNNGPWMGLNESEKFAPASLLKVPVMITILKMAEKDPNILLKKMVVDVSSGLDYTPVYKVGAQLDPEKEYTVREVMEQMIVYSDNEATAALLNEVISLDDVYATFTDLHVQPPETSDENFISVKNYAMFFRVLFNASYLSPESSEYALGLLSGTTFSQGLVSGIPSNIRISHKFGEREYNGMQQLHDCGIVYFPESPYLLCVMTRGRNFSKLAPFISEISRRVYEDISSQARE